MEQNKLDELPAESVSFADAEALLSIVQRTLETDGSTVVLFTGHGPLFFGDRASIVALMCLIQAGTPNEQGSISFHLDQDGCLAEDFGKIDLMVLKNSLTAAEKQYQDDLDNLEYDPIEAEAYEFSARAILEGLIENLNKANESLREWIGKSGSDTVTNSAFVCHEIPNDPEDVENYAALISNPSCLNLICESIAEGKSIEQAYEFLNEILSKSSTLNFVQGESNVKN